MIPSFFELEIVGDLLDAYNNDGEKKAVPFHPTRIETENAILLHKLVNRRKLKQLFESGAFFDGNVSVDWPLIFRKDKENVKKVVLHNDIDYMAGASEAYSFFFALTDANPSNGGLIIYPATHNFGSLGDAGELNADVLPDGYPFIRTDLRPGDLLIMHSAIWHCSDANFTGNDRVYLELKVKAGTDPTANVLVSGGSTSEFKNRIRKDLLFVNSREQRLKALYNEKNSSAGKP
jgi:ectoine hydroxylase-related dioxygenase (phytanoyl-CoA dioxygenase family)